MVEEDTYTVHKISKMAQVIDQYTTEARKKNLIYAFGDADITEALRKLKEHKEKTGESISLTAFLIACFARVVAKHKNPINAYRKGKKKLWVFDEVDVLTNIEKDIDGVKKPVNYTVRNADTKTLRQIHEEIRGAQNPEKVELTQGNKGGKKLVSLFPSLPRFIRKFLMHKFQTVPKLKKKMFGTVGVTAVGMFAKEVNTLGTMIHITPHTMSLGVGSIAKKPEYINGEIVPRDKLMVTVAMDHAIIDGGPATRFLNDMYFMILSGCHDLEWCFESLTEEVNQNFVSV